jgi:hypothetical protein
MIDGASASSRASRSTSSGRKRQRPSLRKSTPCRPAAPPTASSSHPKVRSARPGTGTEVQGLYVVAPAPCTPTASPASCAAASPVRALCSDGT